MRNFEDLNLDEQQRVLGNLRQIIDRLDTHVADVGGDSISGTRSVNTDVTFDLLSKSGTTVFFN